MKLIQECRRPFVASKWPVVGLALLAAGMLASGLRAQNPTSADVFRVEEDWSLVIDQPDLDNNGPQVTCTISPADMTTAYCAFDVNYHTQPDYVAGGMQLHTWDPLDPVEIANSGHTGMLENPGETVSWTQSMTWTSGIITFRVLNGRSQTWGRFGGLNGTLWLDLPTSLPNLDTYDPNVSVANSGVSFAGNLVTSLTLTAVRWYDVNGQLIKQVTTPQVVYPTN
jgi:hypothetical protein